MSEDFVHLHLHTEYSLLDGAAHVHKIVGRAAEMGMKSLAITDHGNMFGFVKFCTECVNQGIKPIVGCEIYVAPRTRFDKEHPQDREMHHLLLLVENETGYKNLVKIVSLAHTEGFYYRMRADRELLERYHEGLIAFSACLGGEVPAAIRNGEMERARKIALWHRDVFGQNNYFLEIMDNGLEQQAVVNAALIQLSSELGIPLVATNDVHYIEPEDALVQDVMMCVEQGKTLEDSNRLSFESKEFYLKSVQEMKDLFPDNPDALQMTVEIAERCNYKLPLGNIFLPDFKLDNGEDTDVFLKKLTFEGLNNKYPALNKGITERAEYELKVIQDMGYSAYFLIVWDLIRFARLQGIPVGPGRGSVAGSIVAFALGITQIDPLKYDLLFERFLNPARVTMPDIDMDFCYERRGEVIEYAKQKYGADKVAMIITFGREKARAAIRDVGRVLGMPLPVVDKVAKLVPFIIPDQKVTIDSSIEYIEELRYLNENDPEIRRLLDISRQIEGLPRNISTHAAGVVISKLPLTDQIPIYQSPRDSVPMTMLVHEDLELLGLMKMDFLGLRTLTVMSDAVRYIEKRTGNKIFLDSIPLNDEKTFKLFCNSETNGIFQFEGNTIKNLLVRSQPRCLEDLIALNALNRPGPLGGGMVDIFLENRKKKRGGIDYVHPSFEPFLRDTFGIILYQEQVMRIANVAAGFSLAEADNLRRAMAKKKKHEMEKLQEQFTGGAADILKDRELAEKIFFLIEKFSGYGFNKSHSAAYAYLAYQTGYLKANYPVEFMSALLTSVMGDSEKVAKYIEDCRRMAIEVAPPDVNAGYHIFTPYGNKISFGLGAVKNVGEGAIDAIAREREENGPYKTLFEFCRRIDLKSVNAKACESLIRAGAMDNLEGNRAQKMAALDEAMKIGRTAQSDRDSGQGSLFGGFDDSTVFIDPKLPESEEFDTRQLLSDEKELLGLYVSHHPLDPYRAWVTQKADITAAEIFELNPSERKTASVAGLITRIHFFNTKTGDQMAFVDIEDFTGKIMTSFNPTERQKYASALREDNVVAVKGRLWAKHVDNQDGTASVEFRIMANQLESFNQGLPAGKKSEPVKRRIHFRIASAQQGEKAPALIKELQNLISANSGQSEVIVHIDENGKGRMFLLKGSEARFSPEFLRIARRIFGESNVWVETDRT
jgi:DNA polymerase III subunit alpha